MLMKVSCIISDADGTLVDTVSLIRHGQYEAAKTYLEHHGIPAEHIPSYETYERFLNSAVGGSTRETFERTFRLLYERTPEHLDGIDYDELNATLKPIQDRIAPSYVKPMPGLVKFLFWVGSTGRSLAIFTSGSAHMVVRNFGIALPELGLTELYLDTDQTDARKQAQFIAAMRAHFGIRKLTVVTCEDVTRTKPNPESFELALDRLDGKRADTAVLGDHSADMETGVNAGVAICIGITHGFHEDSQLVAAGATHVVDSLEAVTTYLR